MLEMGFSILNEKEMLKWSAFKEFGCLLIDKFEIVLGFEEEMMSRMLPLMCMDSFTS